MSEARTRGFGILFLMARLRAHFDGKVLVPLERVELPTDRVLEIEVLDGGQLKRG